MQFVPKIPSASPYVPRSGAVRALQQQIFWHVGRPSVHMSEDGNDQSLQTMRIGAEAETDTKTVVRTRGHELVIDEPEPGGGTDDGPTPIETLIGAQAGCLNVVGHKVAADMGVDVQVREIDVEGAFDPAKVNGRSDDPRAGLQEVRVNIQVDTDEDTDVVREWARRVEERCPVTENIVNETRCETSVSVW